MAFAVALERKRPGPRRRPPLGISLALLPQTSGKSWRPHRPTHARDLAQVQDFSLIWVVCRDACHAEAPGSNRITCTRQSWNRLLAVGARLGRVDLFSAIERPGGP